MRVRLAAGGVLMSNDHEALDRLFAGKPDMLTVGDVADLLGITKNGVYRWIKEGVVPAYKLGALWFIPRDELRDRLVAGRNSSAAEPDSPHEQDA